MFKWFWTISSLGGADIFNRKNSKYVATLKDGKKVNFGNQKYEDFLIHGDEERRQESLARAKKIKNKKKELTCENPESANYRVDSSIVGWCRIQKRLKIIKHWKKMQKQRVIINGKKKFTNVVYFLVMQFQKTVKLKMLKQKDFKT